MSTKKPPPKEPPGTGFFLMGEKTLYGPYTRREVDFLKGKGAFSRFSWIWDNREKRWKALDEPISTPPLPTGKTKRIDVKELKKELEEAEVPKSVQKKPTKIRALCFDKRNAVTGWISQINRKGALFITQDERSLPPFSKKQKVSLNLILQETRQSMTIDAELVKFVHAGDKWQYEIRWKQFPKELTQLIEVILPQTGTLPRE